MAGFVIEEFLIQLGFQVSRSGINKFNDALGGARNGFSLLAKAAEVAAGVVEFAIGKISKDLDDLYFAAQRTKASAENLTAFAYAARQTGSSADAAAQAVESLASKLRRNPGMAQFFANFGVNTSDPAKMIEQLQHRLSSLPMFIQLQYADMIGVDEKTWLSLSKEGPFKAEQAQVAARLGLNIDQAAKAANTLWTQLRSVGMVLESIGMKIVQELAGKLGGELLKLKNLLLNNSDGIVKAIEYLTKGIVGLIELVARLVQTFGMLPPFFKYTIEAVAGLVVAWKALNLVMAASPITWLIAGLTAFLLLMDDYYAYKKHGKAHSLFNWDGIDDIANKIKNALAEAGDYIKERWQWLLDFLAGSQIETFIDKMNRQLELLARATGFSHREDAPDSLPGSNNAQTEQKAAKIQDILRREGEYKDDQIAGILGNLSVENSGFDPQLKNSTGHVGIAQWDKAAQEEFTRVFGGRLEDADLETQTRFLIWELNHGEKAAGDELRAAQDPDSATEAYLHRERPANPGTPEYYDELRRRVARSRFYKKHLYSLPQDGPEPPPPKKPLSLGGGFGHIPRPEEGMDYQHEKNQIDPPEVRLHPSGSKYDGTTTNDGVTANIHQHISYNIKSTDPHGVAREIAAMQEESNRTLLRNTKGALV